MSHLFQFNELSKILKLTPFMFTTEKQGKWGGLDHDTIPAENRFSIYIFTSYTHIVFALGKVLWKEQSGSSPKFNLESYRKPSFSFIALSPWNKLAHQLRTTACLSSFFTVKTFLFSRSFLIFLPSDLFVNKSQLMMQFLYISQQLF